MPSKAKSKKPRRPVPTRITDHATGKVTVSNGREAIEATPAIHPDMLKGLERSQAAVAQAEAATGLTPEQLAEKNRREHEAYLNDVAKKQGEALLGTPPAPNLTDRIDIQGGASAASMPKQQALRESPDLPPKPRRKPRKEQPRDGGQFSSHEKLAAERAKKDENHQRLRRDVAAERGWESRLVEWIVTNTTKAILIACATFWVGVAAIVFLETWFHVAVRLWSPIGLAIDWIIAVISEWIVQ
jgi:hypothetical protein